MSSPMRRPTRPLPTDDALKKAHDVNRRREGMQAKAALGKWIGGSLPYGYTIVKGDLAINQDLSVMVRYIFYRRDCFNDSYARIADRVAKKFLSMTWHKIKIARIIKNRLLYEGIYVDPFTKTNHPRRDLRMLPKSWKRWAAQQTDLGDDNDD